MSAADTKPKAGTSEIDQRSIDTIRTLTIDAVQKANSGHAGAPMGLAPVAFTLWNHYLRYDPANPHWPNRDRFVLSVGHASMLLYSLLHLAEVAEKDGGNAPAVSLEDIKKFRQLDSRTPGTRNTTSPPASRSPPGRSARAWRIPSAWRWAAASSASAWPMATGRSSTTTSTRCAATAT